MAKAVWVKVRPRTKGRSRKAVYQQRHREKKVLMAFAQQHGESAAGMCPLETSRYHPASSTSESTQLHSGVLW